jgi:glycosyltransferase involved in cell wall biosynthesis
MPDVVVAIPTFRRPSSLGRLLEALEKIETSARVEVVVADNDAERLEGYDLCRQMRAAYRWPLAAVIAAERGIAQARNALVGRALSNPDAMFVAMIDDDEWPSPQWLAQLLRVQNDTGADIVGGSILFEHAGGWLAGFDGARAIRRDTGLVDMLEGAGNIVITRACLERLGAPWFDPAYGLSGGEDRDFFERAKRAGARFAWADGAVAYGEVPRQRTSLKWMLERAYGIGNTDMRIFLNRRPCRWDRACEVVKIALALLLWPPALLILAMVPNRAADVLRRVFRNAGKLSALMGRQVNRYAVTHGE